MEGLATMKVLKWGNSYGLRIGKRDAERLGLYEGKEVQIKVVEEHDRLDVPHFTFSGDGRCMCTGHDEVLYGWHSRA